MRSMNVCHHGTHERETRQLWFAVRHDDRGQHGKMLLVECDQACPSQLGRCCDERVGESYIVRLAVVPPIEAASCRNSIVKRDDLKCRDESIQGRSFLALAHTCIKLCYA